MRRVLMVAYHFPPLAGSSGIQRTLRFVQHLPAVGWQPLVLTVQVSAYEQTRPDLDGEIPPDCVVRRAFAFDAARQLSVGGRYVGATARPDRWVSWKFGAIRQGMRMIREFRPDIIWSTYPIATAHLIGAELARRSGVPWIADFRDPMAQDGYPADPITWQQFKDIEASAMHLARLNTFTTPGAARMYRERYPAAADRIKVLENGYDEASFSNADANASAAALNPGCLTVLHSGIIYPSERDPTALFVALGRLKRSGRLPVGSVKFRFRAAVHEQLISDLASANDVQALIEVLPHVEYQAALREMLQADALLVMQGSGCNAQIPAKIYEYLRARRPIIGLCDPAGDTAAVLRDAGMATVAHLDSVEEIERVLVEFIDAVRARRAALPTDAAVQGASRSGRARVLAKFMEDIVRTAGAARTSSGA